MGVFVGADAVRTREREDTFTSRDMDKKVLVCTVLGQKGSNLHCSWTKGLHSTRFLDKGSRFLTQFFG